MRNAIDRYKDDADKNLIRTEVGSQNYPPDLQTLVDGVSLGGGGNGAGGITASLLAGGSNTTQFGSAGTPQLGAGQAGRGRKISPPAPRGVSSLVSTRRAGQEFFNTPT